MRRDCARAGECARAPHRRHVRAEGRRCDRAPRSCVRRGDRLRAGRREASDRNFPLKWMATLLRFTIFPLGTPWGPPLDSRNRECAAIALEPGNARERLTAGMYVPKGDDATGRLEAAFVAAIACEPVDEKLQIGISRGKIHPQPGADVGLLAKEKGLITADE